MTQEGPYLILNDSPKYSQMATELQVQMHKLTGLWITVGVAC